MVKLIQYKSEAEPVEDNGELIDFATIGEPDREELTFEPDEFDKEERVSSAKLAAKYIKDNTLEQGLHPSASFFHPNMWFETYEHDICDYTKSITTWHYDPSTPEEEQKELYELLTKRN